MEKSIPALPSSALPIKIVVKKSIKKIVRKKLVQVDAHPVKSVVKSLDVPEVKSLDVPEVKSLDVPEVKPIDNQTYITNYISSLSDKEKITYEIAKSHLGTSFNINKSIGFLDWKSKL